MHKPALKMHQNQLQQEAVEPDGVLENLQAKVEEEEKVEVEAEVEVESDVELKVEIEAKVKRQEARDRMQEARGKRQEARDRGTGRNLKHSRHAEELQTQFNDVKWQTTLLN